MYIIILMKRCNVYYYYYYYVNITFINDLLFEQKQMMCSLHITNEYLICLDVYTNKQMLEFSSNSLLCARLKF